MRIYLVCYDITDDDTRLEVSKILGEYGERVQRSVFEVAIRSEAELEWLRARLEEALGGIPLNCVSTPCAAAAALAGEISPPIGPEGHRPQTVCPL
jgi:hypothetical protein